MSTFLVYLLFLFAAPAQQTTTQNPADLCKIQGVVIKSGTGEPLRKATVSAWREDDTPGNDEPHSGEAETDAMGRFEIVGLAPGRYHLSAERNGFLRQEYGQRTLDGPGAVVTLSSGQKVPDITFQMVPAAVISGHVYDEYGEPVVYAQVLVVHYAYENGQRQLEPPGGRGWGDQTNDRGEFRIFGLSPGQYFLQASLRPSQFYNTKTGNSGFLVGSCDNSQHARSGIVSTNSGDRIPVVCGTRGLEAGGGRGPRLLGAPGSTELGLSGVWDGGEAL